jgi:hypothetical protein
METEQTICITIKEYNQLLDRNEWLCCLEEAGVDNWSGFSVAQDMLSEIKTLQNATK